MTPIETPPVDASRPRHSSIRDRRILLALGLAITAVIAIGATALTLHRSSAPAQTDPISLAMRNRFYRDHPAVGPMVVVSTPSNQLNAPASDRFWLVMWVAAREWVCGTEIYADDVQHGPACDNGLATPGGIGQLISYATDRKDPSFFSIWGALPAGVTQVHLSSTAGADATVHTTELTGDDPPGIRVPAFSLTLATPGQPLGTVRLDALDAQGRIIVTSTMPEALVVPGWTTAS
jgi:hypothetical protein